LKTYEFRFALKILKETISPSQKMVERELSMFIPLGQNHLHLTQDQYADASIGNARERPESTKMFEDVT